MKTMTVTTTEDVVDKSDGVLSLREAIADAAGMKGGVEIVFDHSVFAPDGLGASIELKDVLSIAKGTDVVIDGSLVFPGSSYSVGLVPTDFSENMLTVEAGAKVTLRDMRLDGGTTAKPVIGANGLGGSDGENGQRGEETITDPNTSGPGTGTNGGDGTPGGDAADDAGDGNTAVGGILNRGDLTLERVEFQSLGATGGDGGRGGEGGRGGGGGWGDDARGKPGAAQGLPGRGGDGGDSGDGANGGEGGAAVGGIYNLGSLTIRDVSFTGMLAEGGAGGAGGAGQMGGAGGMFGGFGYRIDAPQLGGDGGDGGDGGSGGAGGDAIGTILNEGKIVFDGVQSKPVDSRTFAGDGGSAGVGGRGGNGAGSYSVIGDTPQDGQDGQTGPDGAQGETGDAGEFAGADPVLSTTFILSTSKDVFMDDNDESGRRVFIAVEKLGPDAGSVKWRLTAGEGVTAKDFEDGVLPKGGTIDMSASTDTTFLGFLLSDDDVGEGRESFTVELFEARGGALGWSRSVTITIDDDDAVSKPILGTPGDDRNLKGTSDNDMVRGLAGDDRIRGLEGDDELYGDGGNDTIDGGEGADRMAGGAGDDVYVVDAKGDVAVEGAKGGVDIVRSSVDFELGKQLEDLELIGKKALDGVGNALANRIDGNGSRNQLDGGLGADTLSGGKGEDVFVFSSKLGRNNIDTITDFSVRDDTIWLDRDVFEGLKAGALMSFAVTGDRLSENATVIYDKKSGALLFDDDGRGGHDAIRFATLDPRLALAADDFLIV